MAWTEKDIPDLSGRTAVVTGANGGLGYLLLVYEAELKNTYVFAILIVLAAIGMALHQIVVLAQRRLVFWSGDANRMTGL